MSSTVLSLSKQEKITILKSRIENFKRDFQNPMTFTYSLYNSRSPKKDHLRAWGEALEDLHKLGEYKDELYTISTTITRELKEMGLKEAVEYVREALPAKYKDSAKIHASILLADELRMREDQPREKVKSDEEIERENSKYIQDLEDDKILLSEIQTKLKHHEFVSKIDPYELDEFFTKKKQLRTLIRQALDGRDKVLVDKLHLFIEAFENSKNFTFTKYMEIVRGVLELTSKQAVKLLTGRVSKVELLFEPKGRPEARQAGFYGTPCPECGSYRMDYKYNTDVHKDMLFCYACKNWSTIKTDKLVSKLI